MQIVFLFLVIFSFKFVDSTSNQKDLELQKSIDNISRNETNIARDKYRNPYKTLSFFGIDKKKRY